MGELIIERIFVFVFVSQCCMPVGCLFVAFLESHVQMHPL